MPITPEHYDAFFAPLVGTSARVDELRDELSTQLKAPNPKTLELDAYGRLSATVKHIAYKGIADELTDISSPDAEDWLVIARNAEFGLGVTAATLRVVGDKYVEKAKVPQTRDNVTKNTYGALRHTYGIAFSGFIGAVANTSALRWGLNPKNRLVLPLASAMRTRSKLIQQPKVSGRSFTAKPLVNGQLEIAPRHKRITGHPAERCPATDAKVMTSEGSRSALFTLIKLLGDVAISEIFPDQFQIADTDTDSGY